MIKNNKNKKGFTLIELLVVIAIIAILAVVVVLTLNPAELLRQARDSNRISDFATLKSALGLYSEDVNTTTPMYNATDSIFGTSGAVTSTTATYEGTASTSFGFTTVASTNNYNAVTTSTSRAVTGSGWLPVNMTAISSGAPIGSLPVDPLNSGNNIYLYGATSTSYKLATKMESVKYGYSGSGSDVVSTDGGNNTNTYEQGSNLQL
jgi:prepilin-type N-terminal cleavage/methylation domain-containing protein